MKSQEMHNPRIKKGANCMNVINLDKKGNIIKDLSKVKFPEDVCKEVSRVLTEMAVKKTGGKYEKYI